MKKIIQITHSNGNEFTSDEIFALTEDGKVYRWTGEQRLVKSTGERKVCYGWKEMIDELNLTPTI